MGVGVGEGYKEWVTTVDGGWEWGEGYSQRASGVTYSGWEWVEQYSQGVGDCSGWGVGVGVRVQSRSGWGKYSGWGVGVGGRVQSRSG